MLDFSISKEQKMIKSEIAKLVKNLVTDNAHDMDENGVIDPATIQAENATGAGTPGFAGTSPG